MIIMPKKSSPELKDASLMVVGTSAGVISPFLLREYCDQYLPDGIPMIPAPWNKLSVIGSIGIGISSLVAGIFFKNYRSVLLPLGISSTSLGVLFGLFPSVKEVPPGGRLRVPGQRAGSKITLRSPGPNQNIKGRNISSNVQLRPARSGNTFAQKNPEERLLILKKEEQDLELKKEADRLEAELKFKKDQPTSALPMRT